MMVAGIPLPVILFGLLAAGIAALVTAIIASLCGHSVRGSWRCFRTGRHEPRRQPMGGFRCASCGEPGDDFDAFGYGPGYVTPPAQHEARAAVRDNRPPQWVRDLRFYRGGGKS